MIYFSVALSTFFSALSGARNNVDFVASEGDFEKAKTLSGPT